MEPARYRDRLGRQGIGGGEGGTGLAADGDLLVRRLVPDELWRFALSLIPGTKPRRQGGGRRRSNDRAVLAAILFVLASGSPWRSLPASFGVAAPTAYRRYGEWTANGLWAQLDAAVRRESGNAELADWTAGIVAASRLRGINQDPSSGTAAEL